MSGRLRGITVSLMSPVATRRVSILDYGVRPGAYFTDGIRLYRVVNMLLDPWKGESFELEDCMTLRTSCYSADALEQLGLEPVRPVAA